MRISTKELGKRISALRKRKGYSQEELANMINMSRASFTQIELGNRNVSAIEIKEIASILLVSIDWIVSEDFTLDREETRETLNKEDNVIRISVPELKSDKIKNILLYILQKCAGKPNFGETLLYKILYFSDFNYYELYEEHLSGAEYRKLPFGPVPQKLDFIIDNMISSNMIERYKSEYHGFHQKKYLPLQNADLTKLKASEKEVIDKVIELYSGWTASAISDYSHKDIPWLATDEGNIIDYELAFYREFPYSVRNYDKNPED